MFQVAEGARPLQLSDVGFNVAAPAPTTKPVSKEQIDRALAEMLPVQQQHIVFTPVEMPKPGAVVGWGADVARMPVPNNAYIPTGAYKPQTYPGFAYDFHGSGRHFVVYF
jgi:hypothetical protein